MFMLKGEKIQAFTAQQVCELSGNTPGQLAYWDKTDFFSPRFTGSGTRSPYRKIYSFRDLVGLRAIARLRNDKGVPLQELRKIGEFLKRNYAQPWSSLRFIVAENGKVYTQEPGKDLAFEARDPGQGDFLVIQLEDVAVEINEKIISFKRPHGRISKNRYIVRNDPVIQGTRIRTEAIWNYHKAGYSTQAIIEEFPSLTAQDIRAAIRYEKKSGTKKAA